MNRIPLSAQERTILGKKVKTLRRDGFIPAHVFGNKLETEHVAVKADEFSKVYRQVGETGLIDLRIGEEKVRPVLVREIQVDPLRNNLLHIDFYQVNLKEKVRVSVPVELVGDEPEAVHTGEAVVIQPIGELEVEALPSDLPEKIEVDIAGLKQIDDAITVAQLAIPEGVEVLADQETVVVKLDTAITEEMKKLMEEQAAETAAAAEAAGAEEAPAEGEEGAEEGAGETQTEESTTDESKQDQPAS